MRYTLLLWIPLMGEILIDCITCEDVVIGYLTVFKIILNDMRPLVYSLYDEEKWADESNWK